MEWNYDKITEWFDAYFEEVSRSQGNLETVPNLKKYFAANLVFTMYTGPSSPPATRMSRDELLISFVHPGLHEGIVPKNIVIDVRKMIVTVQFEIRFIDKPSGTEWPPLQASAHYHLDIDENEDLKIIRIYYWTETLPKNLFDCWDKRREEAFRRHALGYINSTPGTERPEHDRNG